MMYFFNHCEVPALLNGTITAANPRVGVRRPILLRRRMQAVPPVVGQNPQVPLGNQTGSEFTQTINNQINNQQQQPTINNIPFPVQFPLPQQLPQGFLQPFPQPFPPVIRNPFQPTTGLQFLLPQPTISPFGPHPNSIPPSTQPTYVFGNTLQQQQQPNTTIPTNNETTITTEDQNNPQNLRARQPNNTSTEHD